MTHLGVKIYSFPNYKSRTVNTNSQELKSILDHETFFDEPNPADSEAIIMLII